MLTAISYNQGWHCDISMILWNTELCALHYNGRISWLIISQSLKGRVSKQSFLQAKQQDTKFIFDESAIMDIGVSRKIIDDRVANQSVSTGRETYWLDGKQVSMKTLMNITDNSGEWIILTAAGAELAKQKRLWREDEQALVEWLFKWITQREREIICSILNP